MVLEYYSKFQVSKSESKGARQPGTSKKGDRLGQPRIGNFGTSKIKLGIRTKVHNFSHFTSFYVNMSKDPHKNIYDFSNFANKNNKKSSNATHTINEEVERARRQRQEMLHKIRKDKRYDEMSRRRHLNPEADRESEMNSVSTNNNNNNNNNNNMNMNNVNMNIAASSSSSLIPPNDINNSTTNNNMVGNMNNTASTTYANGEPLMYDSNGQVIPVSSTGVVHMSSANNKHVIKEEDIQASKILMANPSIADKRQGVAYFKKILSNVTLPSASVVDRILRADILPPLINNLMANDSQVKEDSSMCVSSIASGSEEHVRALMSNGALDPLLMLLTCNTTRTREHALWSISSISDSLGSDSNYLNTIINAGIIDKLQWNLGIISIDSVKNTVAPSLSTMRHMTWLLMSITRGVYKPPEQASLIALKMLADFLQSPDAELCVDSIRIISCICDYSENYIQYTLEYGILTRIIELYQKAGDAAFPQGIDADTQISLTRNSGMGPTYNYGASNSAVQEVVGTGAWLTSNAMIFIRSATITFILIVLRSSELSHVLMMLTPQFHVLDILFKEIPMHTNSQTSAEACHALTTLTFLFKTHDSGGGVFDENFVEVFYDRLINEERLQILVVAAESSTSDLRTAAIECINSLFCAIPFKILCQHTSFISIMCHQLREFYSCYRLEPNKFDNTQIAHTLNTHEKLYIILSKVFTQGLHNYPQSEAQNLLQHARYTLPEISESVEDLLVHPASIVSNSADRLIKVRDLFNENLNSLG